MRVCTVRANVREWKYILCKLAFYGIYIREREINFYSRARELFSNEVCFIHFIVNGEAAGHLKLKFMFH